MKPIFIQNFLPDQILNILNSYCIIKYSNKKEFDIDWQTNSLVSEYGDPLMETILDLSTPVIEQNVGKKLFPTNSFFRIYDKGDDLKVHIDREPCEYTVALCIGADPVDKPWEIFVGKEDENSDYKYFKEDDKIFKRYRIDYKFPMVPNNAVIFRGAENVHWREMSTHDHYITVFFHYVDQEGPFKHHKFDKRPMLGSPK